MILISIGQGSSPDGSAYQVTDHMPHHHVTRDSQTQPHSSVRQKATRPGNIARQSMVHRTRTYLRGARKCAYQEAAWSGPACRLQTERDRGGTCSATYMTWDGHGAFGHLI
nr:hypothetical protein CFP56_75868 [Quercus suber]